MAAPTLSELLTIPTISQVLDQEIFPAMRSATDSAGNPIPLQVTNWSPFSPWRIISYIIATLRRSDRSAIATRTAAGFSDYCFGNATPPSGIPVTSWAGYRARSWYGVDPIGAAWHGGDGGTYTTRNILLTNSSASSYGPLAQGTMILQFSSGDRYVQEDDAVTVPGSGSITVLFRSEFTVDSATGRNYNDASGVSPIVMVNAGYPGVVATNPAPTYSDVAQTGPGLGTVTPSITPTQGCSVAIRISLTGVVAAGELDWRMVLADGTDSGWTTGVPIDTLDDLFGNNVHIEFANNGGNFLEGTYYYFVSPGSDVVTRGRDAETPQELGARCKALFPSFAFSKDAAGNWIPGSPTITAYEALARTAFDQVKICFVKTDGTINDKVNIYVAAQGALLDPGVIALIQAFFDAYQFISDVVEVRSPTAQAIALGAATVSVTAALEATAKIDVQRRVTNYLTGVDPANPLTIGDGSTVKVQHAYLVSLIRGATGVVGLTDTTLTINTFAADYVIPAGYLATFSQQLSSALTWAPV